MRIRKTNALLGAGLVLSACFFMYLVIDGSSGSGNGGLYDSPETQRVELGHLETKLEQLERDLVQNQGIINDIKVGIYGLVERIRSSMIVSKGGIGFDAAQAE